MLNHSQWTTLANRLCRTYISTTKPSAPLKLLVKYIMQVYAPLAIQIKRFPSCVSGAKHIHKLMQSSRFLIPLVPSAVMKKYDQCIHRNGYYAHPENVLLAMCDDDRQPIRALAYRRILNARSAVAATANGGVRQFKVPMLQYKCNDYVDMIRWQKLASDQQTTPLLRDLAITADNIEPLAMFKITDPTYNGKIINDVGEEVPFNIELQNLPCHSQAVERCVKYVTDASKMVCGEAKREGYIIGKARHRSMMPLFMFKKQFVADDIIREPKV